MMGSWSRLLWTLPPIAFLALNCSDNKELGAGEECFQATECSPGLICAPVGGKRVCTNDLTGIASPSGYDAETPDGGVVRYEAGTYDAPTAYDAGAKPDTNPPPPPVDSGEPG